VSIESVGDLLQRARAEAAPTDEAGPGSERERLMRVAQEFESMLMLQMLKEMRKAGSWADEDEKEGGSGYGAQTMFETIDMELAGHLTRAQGLGLGKQLLQALEKLHPEGKPEGKAEGKPEGKAEGTPEGRAEGKALSLGLGTITSGFGWRADPFHGAAKFHRGIDIRAAYGQDIPTAASGRVVSAGTEGGYGQTVVIEHAGGIRTRYAHLSTTLVAPGEGVREGQVVGRAGHSGRATGTHLHFEVMTASGKPLNPEQFAGLKADGLVADSTHGTNPVLQETGNDFTN
jgi:murein DD-endopeptidase MepM/ murein hydrolase activator NlpD